MSPPDLRYHIASLAAVFLALGIGILVGTAFVGAPALDRQTRLIQRLEANVTDLRKATAEQQGSETALRTLLPGLLRDKLSSRRVLVIQTGSSIDAANQAADTLRQCGAIVERVALPADAWRQSVEPAASPSPGAMPSPDPESRYASLAEEARQIAPLLAGGDETSLADYRQRGLVTGDPLSGAARYVVLVGGGESASNNATEANLDQPWATVLAHSLDVPLAQSLNERGLTVVGVEPFEAGVSFMRLYEDAGMATIDCIDRAVGRLALPFALLGEKANYGLKPTADRLLPASLENPATPNAASPAPVSSPA